MTPMIRSIRAVQTLPLRSRLLRSGAPLEQCVFADDEHAKHFGAFIGEALVSIASLYVENETRFDEFKEQHQTRLRGMATAPEFQKEGIGRALLTHTVYDARQSGAQIYWCNARQSAATFYEQSGFDSLPHPFDLPRIGPHRVMFKRL